MRFNNATILNAIFFSLLRSSATLDSYNLMEIDYRHDPLLAHGSRYTTETSINYTYEPGIKNVIKDSFCTGGNE